jgi:23S rRNA (adenine2503-C2)-methyltransferase
MTPESLTEHSVLADQPKFRAKQVCDWIFVKGITDLDNMGNLPAPLRKSLADTFSFAMPEVTDRLDAPDGSSKLLLKTERGNIEAVILRYSGRVSLCVSSQVGCKLACRFCQTGKLGFMRHLSREEILAQFVMARQIVAAEGRRLSHVVFMGMGEPLDNYDAVVHASKLMIDPKAFGLSGKNVTISTSGLVPQIEKLADDIHCSLAISLHAANDELRTSLMPINRRYPLEKLKHSLMHWQQVTGRKLTIEYILIAGQNCDKIHAKQLVKFLHGLRAKINLIPFNAHPGLEYQRPDDEQIREFQSYLTARSFAAPVRYSKGLDVSAACGQLAAKVQADLLAAPARSRLLTTETTQPQI